MITSLQGQQQFDAADRLEAAVLKGRWKGLVAEKLWLIECEQGIMLEMELDKAVKSLRLIGTPDATPDGKYLLQFTMSEGKPCPNKRALKNPPCFEVSSRAYAIFSPLRRS